MNTSKLLQIKISLCFVGANAIPGLFHYVEELPADDKCAFNFSSVQKSDYNFTSLQFLIRDDPVILTGPLGRTV